MARALHIIKTPKIGKNEIVSNKRLEQERNKLLLNFEAKASDAVLNLMYARTEWMRRYLADQRRDIDKECNYPETLTSEDFKLMFDRNGIAVRVTSFEALESWKFLPEVTDAEDTQETEFQKAWKDLCEKKKIFSWLRKIDVLSGIGRYGILLVGIDDGEDNLANPIDGFPDSGELEDGEKPTLKHKLLYLRALDESLCRITEWESDPTSPRYGHPTEYSVSLIDPTDLTEAVTVGYQELKASKVHWTRVIHICDNNLTSEIFGVPRQRDVFNWLINIKKILGANGEGFWQSAFPGLSFETQPGLENIDLDVDALKTQISSYMGGLQRYFATVGMNVKSLAGAATDPTAHFETQCKAIAISKGWPYRIFMGTEEAKLAGGQDAEAFAGRMMHRQENHLEPNLVRKVVDTFIILGILPYPKNGKYSVRFPDLLAPGEDQIAGTALKQTQAMQAYVQGGVNQIMVPEDFYTQILGMDEDQVDVIIENAMGQMQDELAGKDVLIGTGAGDGSGSGSESGSGSGPGGKGGSKKVGKGSGSGKRTQNAKGVGEDDQLAKQKRLAKKKVIQNFNPNHEPAGTSKGGEFASKSGSSSGSKSKDKARAKNSKAWWNSLTEEEKHVTEYWSYMMYKSIRECEAHPERFVSKPHLVGTVNDIAARTRQNVADFNSALDKGIIYKGEMHRGLMNVTPEDVSRLTKVGTEFEHEASSSYSTKVKTAKMFASGEMWGKKPTGPSILLTVKENKTGVSLKGALGRGGKEGEVVGRKGAKYQVVKVEQTSVKVTPSKENKMKGKPYSVDMYHVFLEEVSNG